MTPTFECNLPPYLAYELEAITHEGAVPARQVPLGEGRMTDPIDFTQCESCRTGRGCGILFVNEKTFLVQRFAS